MTTCLLGAPFEPVEEPLALARRNAWAAVLDREHDPGTRPAHLDRSQRRLARRTCRHCRRAQPRDGRSTPPARRSSPARCRAAPARDRSTSSSRALKRSTHASAIVAMSTASEPGGGGAASKRASQSRSSTMRLRRPLSRPIRSSTPGSELASAPRANESSASITLSGVRSSWDASAVNSSCRRRASSIGLAARSPMKSDARKMATRSTGAATSSEVTSTPSTWDSSVRLSPATRRPPR